MRGSLVVRLLRGGGGDDVPEEDTPWASVCGGWDPNDVCHVLLAGVGGEIRSCDLARGDTTPARRFQLCRRRRKGRTVGEEEDGEGEEELVPVGKPWRQVEMVPGRPGELLFVLEGSEKLLYVRLPEQDRAAFRFHPPDQDALHRGDVGRRDMSSSGFSQVYQLGSHASVIAAFAVAPDGLLAVSAGKDGSLLLWRLTDGALAAITALAPEEAVTAVAFEGGSSDDEDGCDKLVDTLVTGHKDGSVRLWRVPDEAHELYLEADDGVPSLQLQHTLPEMNDGSPVVCLSTFSPHRSDPTTSADTSFLAVGFQSGTVQLWSFLSKNSKQCSRLLWSLPAFLDGSSNKPRQALASLALRKDGALLAVAYSSGLLQLHCLTEKRPAKCFKFRREGGVVRCAYSDAVPVRKPSPAAELLLVCLRTGPLRVVRDEELIEVASTPDTNGADDQQGSVVRRDEGGDDDGGGRDEDDNPVPQKVPVKLRVAHEAAVALASSLQQQQLQQREQHPMQALPPKRTPKPAHTARPQFNTPSTGDIAVSQANIASERARIETSQAAGALLAISEEESISNGIAQSSTCTDALSVQPAPCVQPSVLSSVRVAARLQRATAEEFDRAAALQAVGPAASVAAATAAGRAAGPYVELKPVEEVQPLWAPKVIGKQLHPKWVASLEAKPSLEALWRPSDWEPEVCNTKAIYQIPESLLNSSSLHYATRDYPPTSQ